MNSGHDTSADNWSLGVLMYELIDGANPFWEDGMDQQTLYELIVYGLHPPISRKVGGFVEGFVFVLASTLTVEFDFCDQRNVPGLAET